MDKSTNNEDVFSDETVELLVMAAAQMAWKNQGLPVADKVMPEWDSYQADRKCDVEAAWEAGFATSLLLQREAMRLAKHQ